ncbi:MAG: histidine phosphatase family protein [Parvularculaceae bacterium]|nr:histidine phosphatase family protein [Parvularculaceae bacterium]
MKLLAIFSVLLAGATLASCATADETDDVSETLAMLRAGGNIIVMRHATSPSGQKAAIGMTSGCELAPGRGLSAQGFFEARFVGEWFAENGVRIDRTYTSDLCRSYDTARLVAAAGSGPVIPRAEMKSDDPAVADAFKRELLSELAVAPASNILLVTHSNITPLYWAGPLAGEDETPSGRAHVVRDGATVRIDVNPTLSAVPAVTSSPDR